MPLPNPNRTTMRINRNTYQLLEHDYNNIIAYSTIDGETNWDQVIELIEKKGRIIHTDTEEEEL